MNAALDIGNTRMKLALFEKRELAHYFVFAEEDLDGLFNTLTNFDINRIAVCSTKVSQPKIRKVLSDFDLLYLDHTTSLPIKSNYKTPETLGKDRLAAAVGAFALYPDQRSAIIDTGTCMTLDFIDEKGVYQGGNISPGIRMRIEAMHAYTDKLPLVPTDLPTDLLGKTTESALQNGALRGILFEIDGFVKELSLEEKEINIILTGGDAEFLAGYLKTPIFVSPNLVLIGLNEILLHNV